MGLPLFPRSKSKTSGPPFKGRFKNLEIIVFPPEKKRKRGQGQKKKRKEKEKRGIWEKKPLLAKKPNDKGVSPQPFGKEHKPRFPP